MSLPALEQTFMLWQTLDRWIFALVAKHSNRDLWKWLEKNPTTANEEPAQQTHIIIHTNSASFQPKCV